MPDSCEAAPGGLDDAATGCTDPSSVAGLLYRLQPRSGANVQSFFPKGANRI